MPDKISKYRIDGVLGKGAMGVVYKAFDPHIARTVALKTIRKELLHDDQGAELVARFKNEARASGRLTHPNIVAVYDYGETEDAAYIAMEYVEGTPLNALLVADQPTEMSRAMVWMTQLLRALAYAHERGVVHRDIKPANLIITAAAELKIADFGIARIESSALTQTGSMIGTPSYMSPEQFRGIDIDGRSDVFSAGIVLYQMLTGLRPFVGGASVVMHQILNEMPAPPSNANVALGTNFDGVIRQALAKEPGQRFASANAFLDALTLAFRQGVHDPAMRDAAPTLTDSDRTVLAVQVRAVQAQMKQPDARSPTSSSLPSGMASLATASQTGASATTMTPWKLEVYPLLERELSRQIGPIAKVLLKKAGGKASNLDELSILLMAHIPSQSGQATFQNVVDNLKCKVSSSTTQTGSVATTSAITSMAISSPATVTDTGLVEAIAPEFVLAAEKILTLYIGAIAKIVVKRALTSSTNKKDFVARLSRNIDSTTDRNHFLKEVEGI